MKVRAPGNREEGDYGQQREGLPGGDGGRGHRPQP